MFNKNNFSTELILDDVYFTPGYNCEAVTKSDLSALALLVNATFKEED